MHIKAGMIEAHMYRKKGQKIEYLLLKRGAEKIYPNLWQMVTGKIHEGEKAYETVLREVKEETCLTVKKLYVVPNVNCFYEPMRDELNFVPVFLCYIEEAGNVVLSEEHSHFKWVGKNKAKELFAWPGQRKSLDIIHAYLNGTKTRTKFVEINIGGD